MARRGTEKRKTKQTLAMAQADRAKSVMLLLLAIAQAGGVLTVSAENVKAVEQNIGKLGYGVSVNPDGTITMRAVMPRPDDHC